LRRSCLVLSDQENKKKRWKNYIAIKTRSQPTVQKKASRSCTKKKGATGGWRFKEGVRRCVKYGRPGFVHEIRKALGREQKEKNVLKVKI